MSAAFGELEEEAIQEFGEFTGIELPAPEPTVPFQLGNLDAVRREAAICGLSELQTRAATALETIAGCLEGLEDLEMIQELSTFTEWTHQDVIILEGSICKGRKCLVTCAKDYLWGASRARALTLCMFL